MSTNFLDNEGLKVVATNINSRLKMLTAMPESAKDGLVRLFTGETAGKYIKGHVYQAKTTDGATTWLDITPVPETPLSVHGTIEFKNLPALKDVEPGWMYNISDDFKTTSDFVSVGAVEKAGSNVYCIEVDGTKKWDVFAVFVTDQIYDKSSTNAQSGTAVAQAAAAVAAKAKEDNNKKLDKSYTMPEKPYQGFVTVYVGETNSDFTKGHLYEANIGSMTFEDKTWTLSNGSNFILGNAAYIKIFGDDVYYFYNATNYYVLDKTTGKWVNHITKGLGSSASFYPNHVWSDGSNIYMDYQTNHYVLDKTTETWSVNNWNGNNNYYFQYVGGMNIWTDGDNIYGSGYNTNTYYHYVLDKATKTWTTKTWNGLTNFVGNHIWTDGDNIYCSAGSSQYVLDKETSTWNRKNWNVNIYGNQIWKNGDSIYCFNGSQKYVLNRATDTWEENTVKKIIIGNTDVTNGINSSNFWTDGDNSYYIYSSNNNYIVHPEVEWSDLTSSSDSTEAISTTDVTALLD